MREHNVPEWYIWSCKKIKYMFPKAHAAAYVMMAWRIAWFKVFKPLAYYAAFFSIRATAFSYETDVYGTRAGWIIIWQRFARNGRCSCQRKNRIRSKICVLYRKCMHEDLEFMPIDLYRAKANRFQIIDGKLMPALN